MSEKPGSLQDNCLEYICKNFENLCRDNTSQDNGETHIEFIGDEVFFHSNLADQLLQRLCEYGKLNDQNMQLFDAKLMNLKRVHIRFISNGQKLTAKGLQVLKLHKIQELEAIGLRDVTVNGLVGCLGEWTLKNLTSLNVSNTSFVSNSHIGVVVSLAKLKNLKSLNVSNTELTKHGLEIITQDLPGLESLDISSTLITDLTPLKNCKARLKYLSMYGLRASHSDDAVAVLCELSKLRHLDISDHYLPQHFVTPPPVRLKVDDLLSRTKCLPELTSLDLSGKEDISKDILVGFLKEHPGMTFLGLALNSACQWSMFLDENDKEFNPQLKVTGEASEKQLMESLQRYKDRAVFVQRGLYFLFNITHHYTVPRLDIIKLIIPAMKAHPKELGVQMAATACLYNLSKGDIGKEIHPNWLAHIVNLTMDAMEMFSNHQQLQKNALLTLCSDRILHSVNFNRFRCARLVMDCLCAFDNPSMNRMSVAICSILAAMIPTEQTTKLGSNSDYMRKLLSIVKQKSNEHQADITMKFTLSALWNLTDESPVTCRVFLNERGMELFMEVLKSYSDISDEEAKVQVETKILGLINNLAEVKSLRTELMRDDVLEVTKMLLNSKHIDVSYFAAGILSHLVCDGPEAWISQNYPREEMLEVLGQAVLKWEQPQGAMVAYRSFSPFFPLLVQFDCPEVQLWAVWAINHVCNKNGPRYCPMLEEEGGTDIIEGILGNTQVNQDVARIAKNVLGLVQLDNLKRKEKEGSGDQ